LGSYRSAFRGTGLVFTDLRAYQPGDDVKHIHWKATARTGTVFVKSYEEDRQLRLVLAVDTSMSMRTQSTEDQAFKRAIEFCATVSALAQRGNDLVGLALFSDRVQTFLPPASGQKRLHTVLTALLSAPSNAVSTDLAASLDFLATNQRKPGIIFVLSDFICPPFEKELHKLALNHDVVLVQLEPPIEQMMNCGIVSFCDAESGQLVTVDTSSQAVQTAWKAELNRRRAMLTELSQRCGADHIIITRDATEPLVALMRERAAKRAR
jgi:uncharacterized protein (DUF58 family)